MRLLCVWHVVLKCKQLSIFVKNVVSKQTGVALMVQCLQVLHHKREQCPWEIFRSTKEKQRKNVLNCVKNKPCQRQTLLKASPYNKIFTITVGLVGKDNTGDKYIWGKTGPLEQGGRGGVSPPPLKFYVDVLFFADESFKCTHFEKSNQQYTWKSTDKITSKLK